MKIVLVRHGQPDFNAKIWIGSNSVRDTLQRYKISRVNLGPEDHLPGLEKVESAYFISSALPRAKDSLKLYQSRQAEVTELLNEAELPHPDRLFVSFPWSFLVVVCRIAWLVGYRSNAPGMRRDRERAGKASELLIDRALEYRTVYAFGHGIMNRLITRELKCRGWKTQSKTGTGYWSSIILTFTAD